MSRDKSYSRLQVALSENLYEKIEAYASMMGITMPEASRHLMIRGLEQVQLLMNSKNSVDALNKMTAAFDRGIDLEEKAQASRPKKVRGSVTPEHSFKNETQKAKEEKVKDMFK